MAVANATMTGSAVQLTTSPQRAMELVFAPAAHDYWVGDASDVSATKGIPVLATGGPVSFGAFNSGALNLNQWYAKGTNADVISYQYTPEE